MLVSNHEKINKKVERGLYSDSTTPVAEGFGIVTRRTWDRNQSELELSFENAHGSLPYGTEDSMVSDYLYPVSLLYLAYLDEVIAKGVDLSQVNPIYISREFVEQYCDYAAKLYCEKYGIGKEEGKLVHKGLLELRREYVKSIVGDDIEVIGNTLEGFFKLTLSSNWYYDKNNGVGVVALSEEHPGLPMEIPRAGFPDDPLVRMFSAFYVPKSVSNMGGFVKWLYNNLGEDGYRKLTERFPREEIFEYVVENLEFEDGELKWLDIGCGPGDFALYLNRTLPKILVKNLDISEKMVEASLEKGLDVELADIQRITDFDNKYQIISSIYVSHYWNDLGKALENIYRLLEDDGVAVFAVRRLDDNDEELKWFNSLRSAGFNHIVINHRKVKMQDDGLEIPVGIVIAKK